MDQTNDDESLVAHWMRVAAEYGVLPHERDAVHAVAGLLAGALAICIDTMERPTEATVLAVFQEVCRRADAPSETPVRTMH